VGSGFESLEDHLPFKVVEYQWVSPQEGTTQGFESLEDHLPFKVVEYQWVSPWEGTTQGSNQILPFGIHWGNNW
jgi:hypothetical protein